MNYEHSKQTFLYAILKIILLSAALLLLQIRISVVQITFVALQKTTGYTKIFKPRLTQFFPYFV